MAIITTTIKWHFSFFIYLILAFFGGLIKEVIVILFFLFIHELGHFFFLRLFKYPVKSIDIYPFGMMMEIDEHKNDFLYKKTLIAFGGIIANLLICILLFPFKQIVIINALIIVINLLPLFPLDGGRLFDLVLEHLIPYKLARKLAVWFGLLLSLSFLFLVLCFYQRIYLLLVILIILKFNFKHYEALHTDWVLFTTNKYLYPNRKLKKKLHKASHEHPVKTLYAGKYNFWNYDNYVISEEVALKDYLKIN